MSELEIPSAFSRLSADGVGLHTQSQNSNFAISESPEQKAFRTDFLNLKFCPPRGRKMNFRKSRISKSAKNREIPMISTEFLYTSFN